MEKSKIKHLKFTNKELVVYKHHKIEHIEIEDEYVNWIHINSLADEDLLESLITKFNISPLVVEDVKNLSLLPKLENYKDYIFMILEDIELNEWKKLETNQLSLILFKNIVISIEETESNIFETVVGSVEYKKNMIENSADNIFFQLVDITVKDYFDVLEDIGERIDMIEDKLLLNPEKEILEDIYVLKKNLIGIRKTLWLMRNSINRLIKNELNFIGNMSLDYFREIYDNLVQLVDLTETYRDICSGMLDIYLSSISNKTNDIMKVLTVLSTIFIPLTFLAGIYGMNFKYFPEIQWKYGYIGFWTLSIIITGFMIRFFKKKKWL